MNHGISQSLTRDHEVIQHVLPLIRMQINALDPDSEESQTEFLIKAVSYMHTYPSVIHHPAEELIFAQLIQYSPESTPLCEDLIEQHQLFKSIETSLINDIDLFRNGDLDAIARIRENGIFYCEAHIAHVDSEEQSVLPLALDQFTEDDWIGLKKQINLESDPLANLTVFDHYASVYDFIMGFDLSSNIN